VQLLIAPLETVITLVLRVGRWIATAAIGIMVLVILTQVFFRYVLNNALPWPDEAARFLMLWMTGLMAPSAFRWGGFVAIDMVPEMLPRRMGLILNLAILVVSLSVLIVALQLGIKHINSGWLFNSSSLKVPLHLIGGEAVRLKLAWMYMSIYVGFVGMTVVGVELILKNLHMLIDENADYGEVPDRQVLSAE
jgi:TRAP-type C4-dicarboxylate transport system permease small subunit